MPGTNPTVLNEPHPGRHASDRADSLRPRRRGEFALKLLPAPHIRSIG